VDRILSINVGKSVVGIKNVTINEPFFQGHWPTVPVMPGVLVIETMAQVSSVLVFTENDDFAGKFAIFLGVDKAKFRRTVVPGDQIVVEAELIRIRRNACKIRAIAKVDGVIAAEAEMMFGIMSAPA
jgi:beta-hydroxyacyl-ACP dehydratase FabZ